MPHHAFTRPPCHPPPVPPPRPPVPPPAPQADSEEASELCDTLGVEVLPTLQFWQGGRMLWEHRGVAQLEQDLGEGERIALCCVSESVDVDG